MATAAVVAAGLVAVALGLNGPSGPSGPVSYSFKPQAYPSGLIVGRKWTLNGPARKRLDATVTLTNGSAAVLQTTYDEVIPDSVAPSVGAVSLTPTPDQIVQRDPVLRYDLNLPTGATTTIRYTVQLRVAKRSGYSRLVGLAGDQMSRQAAYAASSGQAAPVTLATLTASPGRLVLAVGQTATVILGGSMSDGTQAPAAALADLSWSSDDAGVAAVQGNAVVGVSGGTTTVTVQAGSITDHIPVTVNASPSTSGTASPPAVGFASGGKLAAPGVAAPATPATPATPAAPAAPPTSACPGGVIVLAGAACPTPETPQYICPDGVTVSLPSDCPSTAPPATPGLTDVPAPPATTPLPDAPTSDPVAPAPVAPAPVAPAPVAPAPVAPAPVAPAPVVTTTTTTTTTPKPPPPPAPKPTPPASHRETVGGTTNTWTNFSNAGGNEGPQIARHQSVQVACKVTGFRVADGNTWWYRIASGPWSNAYYASADAFYNDGATSGSLIGTPFVDNAVPNC